MLGKSLDPACYSGTFFEYCASSTATKDACCGICTVVPIAYPGTVISFVVGSFCSLLYALIFRAEAPYNLLFQFLSVDAALISLIDRYFETTNRIDLFDYCFVPLSICSSIPVAVAIALSRIEDLHVMGPSGSAQVREKSRELALLTNGDEVDHYIKREAARLERVDEKEPQQRARRRLRKKSIPTAQYTSSDAHDSHVSAPHGSDYESPEDARSDITQIQAKVLATLPHPKLPKKIVWFYGGHLAVFTVVFTILYATIRNPAQSNCNDMHDLDRFWRPVMAAFVGLNLAIGWFFWWVLYENVKNYGNPRHETHGVVRWSGVLTILRITGNSLSATKRKPTRKQERIIRCAICFVVYAVWAVPYLTIWISALNGFMLLGPNPQVGAATSVFIPFLVVWRGVVDRQFQLASKAGEELDARLAALDEAGPDPRERKQDGLLHLADLGEPFQVSMPRSRSVPMAAGRTTPSGRRRESTGGSLAADSSVKVVVRIRPHSSADSSNVPHRFQRIAVTPLSANSLQADSGSAATPASSAALSKHALSRSTFTFDRVIGPDEGQSAVYESAASLVESFLDGMNATILAYGQTSSGKSYTMGTDRIGDEEDTAFVDRQGITPRAVAEVFERMHDAQRESNGGSTFSAKVSYVEIYNEDLIDLLAGDADVRPTVQIREDKQGNIIWSGLREVKVSSAAEVMNLLSAGSTLRQTGATDMNAQSSRSHAIFSLTVTQRKWTGLGMPPAPSPSVTTSPQSPRVQNRLSGIPRVTSPTPGARPSTPSGRPGSRSGLRPPSMIGRPSSPAPQQADDSFSPSNGGTDSWSLVTSKFHFVDLAGSERLKRTSALGDRAKEGISINAGLSSLGNVISALGDPTKKATHIPYRDSKLTRLLQDSLGGNSKTMMVACVSPTEYNLSETLSTLKYANRARNIKNRAEINQVEVGWDDVEHLQRTILKLRAELAVIKAGDGTGMSSIAEEGVRRSIDGAPTLGEAELQQKIAQLTTDLVRAEAGGSGGSDGPATSASAMSREQFERAVEPIVEEYERSLSALESQLSLTRAALGHSEDEMRDLEARVEEELRANEASSHLVEELRIRVAKLSEREATTEAYVRDLEAKLKEVDDADESTGHAVSDLRKELSRNREQSETTEMYIKELEARLAKSDESNHALQAQLEVLERDVQRREEAYKELEARLTLLDTSGEHKLLLAEIDEKDKRLLELERDLDEMKVKAETAAREKEKLQDIADRMKPERETIEAQVTGARRTSNLTPPDTPAETDDGEFDPLDRHVSGAANSDDLVSSLHEQMKQLREAHAATLAELESAKIKYGDSLKEIEDLNSQVQEAKLVHAQPDVDRGNSPSPSSHRFPRTRQVDEEGEEADEVQELSPVNSRNTSPTTLRTARSPQARRTAFHSSQISSPPSPRPTSPSPPGAHERSYEQMKNEVLKLQSVLKDREDEISVLESTLTQFKSPMSPLPPSTPAFDDSALPDSPSPESHSAEPPQILLENGRASTPPPSQPSDHDLNLSPRTRAAFDAIKADLTSTGLGFSNFSTTSETDETTHAQHLDDLMRSMAKKESTHREAIDELEDKLSALQRQHDELTVLSRDQVVNMSSEIEKLRTDLEGRPDASHWAAQLEGLETDLAAKQGELERIRADAEETIESAKRKLVAEYEKLLESTVAEHDVVLSQIRNEHSTALAQFTRERDELLARKQVEHEETLRSVSKQHEEALVASKGEHDKRLEDHVSEHSLAMSRLRSEHESAMQGVGLEIEQALATRLAELTASHSSALELAKSGHARRLEEAATSHQSEVARLKDDFAAEAATRAVQHSSTLDQTVDDLASQHTRALDEAHAAHGRALEELRTNHSQQITDLIAERDAAQRSIEESQEKERLNGSTESEEAKRQRESALDDLRSTMNDAHALATGTLAREHSEALSALAAQHQASIEEATIRHSQALDGLREQNATDISDIRAKHEETLQSVVTDRDEAKIAHQKALSELASLRTREAAAQAALSTLTTKHDGLSKHNEGVFEGQQEEIALLNQRLDSKAINGEPKASDTELQEALDALSTVEKALLESQQERERLMSELHELRGGDARRKPEHDSIFKDLEQYRASVLKLDSELVKTRKERDSLSAQLARASLSSATHHSVGLGILPSALPSSLTNELTPRAGSPSGSTPDRAMSPVNEFGRNSPRPDSRFLPPAVPPPSVPPPAAPVPNSPLPPVPSGLPLSRAARSSTSSSNGYSRNSISNETGTTSLRSHADVSTIDPRIAKRFEEQETQIARLVKQLAHCEGELEQTQGKLSVNSSELARLESEHQANTDLINTLESALNDSERNLRKTRMNANEIVRERDQYKAETERLRIEAQDSHTTSESYRQSVLDMEERLQDQRNREARAERARQELELRMQAASKKRSKYNCL
ncbi:hypothetical protein JCM11491_002819 [Sporobolomyces phaffii]